MNKNFLLLHILLCFAFPFASSTSSDEPLWTYRMEPLYVDYRKPPGYVGKLAYDSAVILPYVSEIHTYLGAFKYRYRTFGAEFPYDWMNPVSTGGWMGAGDHFGIQVLDEALSEEELHRGWYAAAPKTRKSQTPNGWIYAVDIQRWIDPLKFNSLMQEWLNVSGFRYEIIMTPNREFAFEGRLLFDEVERIPDWEYIYYKNPLTVTTDIGTFFYIGSRMEESKWWVRKIHLGSEKSTGRTTPDASMKDRGWFEGDYPETVYDVPDGWVYWIEQKVWFDIQRIEEIVHSFSMNVDGWSVVR